MNSNDNTSLLLVLVFVLLGAACDDDRSPDKERDLAPQTELSSTPPELTNQRTATFTFDGTDDLGVDRFECQLAGEPWQTCRSPQAYNSLAEGSHTFNVRAVDSRGNTDPWPATFTWVVDLTTPDTTLTGGPTAVTNTTSLVWSFSATDSVSVDHVECSLDGSSWENCKSPQTYGPIAEGSHTFKARAVDAAGNVDLTPATWAWAIDLTLPDIAITSAPASVTHATTATFVFNGTDNVAVGSYQCQLDADAWETCTSPKNYASQSAGSHTFEVRAVDTAGNIDLTPATVSWVVDTTPPDTSLHGTPPSVTNATSASFTFSGTDNVVVASYQCRRDAGAWATCNSPSSYISLTAGPHSFDVRSVDTAGNVDLSSATYSWTIDLTAPTTTMTGGPDSVTNAATAVLSFVGDDDVALDYFVCRLDGSVWQTCTSPQPYSSLPTGTHTFDVRAFDIAGNADMTSASWAWSIDQTPPDTTISSAPAAVTNSTSANFSFSGTDNVAVSSYQCRLDAGAWAVCISPKNFTGLANGFHTFDVRAVDTGGDPDPTPESVTWNVDLTAPDTMKGGGPGSATNTTNAEFDFTGSDNVTIHHFECQVDGGNWQTCASPQSYVSLPAGPHSFNARAVDVVGNADATPAAWTWIIDLSPPDTAIGNAITYATTTSFALGGTDDVAVRSIECRLDGGMWTVCTSPQNYTDLAEGMHTFDARAIDAAGNIDPSPATRTWTTQPTPWINQRYPNIGTITTSISLVGAYFGTDTGAVSIGGTPALIQGWSADTVQIAVGPGTPGGPQQIVLTNGLGQTSNSMPFTIRGNNIWLPEDVPEGRSLATAVWTGQEMIVWGGTSGSYLNSGGRYNPATDSWVSTSTAGAPSARIYHTAVWTGSVMVVWGGNGGSIGGRYNPSIDTWLSVSNAGAPSARFGHSAVWTGSQMIVWSGRSGPFYYNSGGRYNPSTDTWMSTSTAGAPVGRGDHTAVWTGSQMVVWGGMYPAAGGSVEYGGSSFVFPPGGRYDPTADSWVSIATADAPTARASHMAVWTGSQMIIWGGYDESNGNTGGRYDPGNDTWTSLSTTGAPTARAYQTAVWDGLRMVVWGGDSTNTGGRYDANTDTWTPTSTVGAPAGRSNHTAVWTGSEMIVWGGGYSNTGGRYDPSTDTWSSTTTRVVPSARKDHTAVWTGAHMIIWGGGNSNTGARYNPSTDTWTSTSTTGAPTVRNSHTAVWTGLQMVVWGGYGGNSYLNTGGRYDPGTDSWVSTTSTGTPTARRYHTAVWAGAQMIVWGGNGSYYSNTGGRYDPNTDTWFSTSITGAPTARSNHSMVWTGSQVIVWAGRASYYLNTGGRYDPSTDTWSSTSTTGVPYVRATHTAVWTGSKMVVWGGDNGSYPYWNTGGRYDPSTDTWLSTSTTGAPSERYAHTAVWTGSKMVIWGGFSGSSGGLNTGGRYDPGADTWASTPSIDVPSGRYYHTAVWTGLEMLVWGGESGSTLAALGRYVP